MIKNVAANIRYLCEKHQSIADVCRRTGINRQQFNRYLAGTRVPSLATLRKLSGFFSVREEDLFLKLSDFKKIVDQKKIVQVVPGIPAKIQHLIAKMTSELPKRVVPGLYFVYFPCCNAPNKTVRAIVSVRKQDDMLVFKRFTKVAQIGSSNRYNPRSKHDGLVVEYSGTTYFIGLDGQAQGGISIMSFHTSIAGHSGILAGLALVKTEWGEPLALRVTLESVPNGMTLRQAFAVCGITDLQSPDIDGLTREMISLPNPDPLPYLLDYSGVKRTHFQIR